MVNSPPTANVFGSFSGSSAVSAATTAMASVTAAASRLPVVKGLPSYRRNKVVFAFSSFILVPFFTC